MIDAADIPASGVDGVIRPVLVDPKAGRTKFEGSLTWGSRHRNGYRLSAFYDCLTGGFALSQGAQDANQTIS
jgi:hypothetical protein